MGNKESRPGKDGSKQERDSYPYYSRRGRKPESFLTLEELDRLYPGVPVIAYARVSRYYAEWRRYLEDQLAAIRDKCERHGHSVHREFKDVKRGWKIQRPKLGRAVQVARRTGYPIVCVDLDRLLRPKEFHPKLNPNAKPSAKKTEKFHSVHHGVSFVLLERDEDIKSQRTKRGHAATGNRGGGDHMPGYKKRRRERVLEAVLEQRRLGFGYGTIAKWNGVKKSTVQTWIKTRVRGYEFSTPSTAIHNDTP